MLDERYDLVRFSFLCLFAIKLHHQVRFAEFQYTTHTTQFLLYIHLGTLRIVHDSPLSHLNGLKLEHLL